MMILRGIGSSVQIKIYTQVWQGRWVKDDGLTERAEQNRY